MMANIQKLKEHYTRIYGNEPVRTDTLKIIEDKLGIELSPDFKEIAGFYSGGFLGGISHHAIAAEGAATNIVDETLRIRKAIGLVDSFVVIAQPSESLIVLNVDKENGYPEVVWCDAVEAKNLNAYDFMNAPDTWDSYMEFFSHLLDDEDGTKLGQPAN